MSTWQKALLIYLASSCGYGFCAMAVYFPELAQYPVADNPVAWLISGGFLALFAALGYSAYRLWRTQHYSWVTLALQMMQLVGFCIGGYKYKFEAGCSLKWLYEDNRMEMAVKLITGEFTVGINSSPEFLSVNLVPLLIIYLLQKHFPSQSLLDPVAPLTY